MYDYFDILSLSPGASEDEIRKAYRKKAKKFHPDVNNAPDAHDKFMQIRKAYEVLMRRKRYENLPKDFYGLNNSHNLWYNKNPYTYTPDFKYYNRYEEKLKARLREEEARKKFQENKIKLKNSIWYYPAYFSLYILFFASILLGGLVISACMYAMYRFHLITIFFLIPFISGSIYLFKKSYDWYIYNKKYFE